MHEAAVKKLKAQLTAPAAPGDKDIYLVASGDLRDSANQKCWPAQKSMEDALTKAFAAIGYNVVRAHPFDPVKKHGFIDTQRMGLDVFRNIHPNARVVCATAVWQYSYHLTGGLQTHAGPILTIANWSGEWPGLVGLLNLNGSLTKLGVKYSSTWSVDFTDIFFVRCIKQWIQEGTITHDASHVRDLVADKLPAADRELGELVAQVLLQEKPIIAPFDEFCMGMVNATFDDAMLNAIGIHKERLSQSALFAGMNAVSDAEANAVLQWLLDEGMTFAFGTDEATELTRAQVLLQCKMYIAAVRIADRYGAAAIGIQYQQGLKDVVPASDLAEGLMNNVHRPPVYAADDATRELFAGNALPHFNEVDQGVAVDCLVTNRVWRALEQDPATTLHDIRWGEHYKGGDLDAFVWVWEISGSAPASHFAGEYKGASGERQPPMYFPLGGSTLKGVSKPGDIVWSRVYVEDNALHADIGRATIVQLPSEETTRRLRATTPQWPIMSAVLHGITRDQLMARHKSNHISVAYATDAAAANQALYVKAACFAKMGIAVHVCGDVEQL